MKLYQRLIAGLTAILMLGSLASCRSENQEIPYTLEEVLSHYGDETNIDDILEDQNNLTDTEKQIQDFTFEKKVSQLESYIEMVDKLTDLGIEPEAIKHKTTAEQYSDLSLEEVNELIASYEGDEYSDIEKLRIKSILEHVNYSYREWIKIRGLSISITLLKRVIQAATCEVSGLEIEYYENCSILEPQKKDKKEPASIVEVKDPICWDYLTYEIPREKSSANVYAIASELIFEMQDYDKIKYEIVRDYSKQALELAKIAIVAGVESQDGQISSKLTEEEARQKVLKMNTDITTTMATETTG